MLFSELKAKHKSIRTEFSYQDLLAEYVTGIFDYEGMPVDPYALRLLDLNLLSEGKAALFWSSHFNKWITGRVIFSGNKLNPYGLLQDAICHDEAGNEERFTDWAESDKCFVFFNTRAHTPDINIERYADILAKIDISINANVVNSRMSPIVIVKDSNTQAEVQEAIEKNHDGHTEVIKSRNILEDGKDTINVVNITDVNASDKIQYLNHAHDDLIRRFLGIYGMNISGTGKMAQQTREEVRGNNNTALVLPYEMIKSRMDTINRFNEVTGSSASVKLSEAWEREEKEAELAVAEEEPEQGEPRQDEEEPEDEESKDGEEGKEEDAEA